MDNFNLKKFLVENKLTYNSRLLQEGMQYFHNGAEGNQIINYDDRDLADDLEALGQGSMDGQDFKAGSVYNIGGQEYKVVPQGDEFKLVLAELKRSNPETLAEDNSDTLADYFYDLRQYTGVTSFETCDEDDWDKVKDYIEKDKQRFLDQHPEIEESEFNQYAEDWIDNIEDQRGFESMNQQDMSYGY